MLKAKRREALSNFHSIHEALFTVNRDQFHGTAAHEALQDAFLLLDSVQQLPPHRRVLSVVLLFRLLSQRLGLDVSQLVDMADRMCRDADSRYFDHIHAIRTYIDREIKDSQ